MNSKKLIIEKSNVENIMDLTPLQNGILFHYLKNNREGAYFEQLSLSLSGNISIDVLKQAWSNVIENNSMLRTVFRWEKQTNPRQIVLKKLEIPFKIIDLKGMETRSQDQEISRIRERDLNNNIDIESYPFRIIICELSNSDIEMILSWNHIIFDGWSTGIILNELMDSYNSITNKIPLKQGNKPGFSTFIKWQKTRDIKKQELFWNEYLNNFEGKTTISFDSVDSKQSGTGKIVDIISKEDSKKIILLCKELSITPASLIYTLWGLLIQFYTNSNDILLGTTVSGRNPEIKGINNIVGLFINTIPLRVKCNSSDRLSDILKNVYRELVNREEFSDTSLTDIYSYKGLSGNNELFDSIVVVENYPLDDCFTKDIKLNGYKMHEITNYPLTLGIQLDDEIEVILDYRKDLFTEVKAERIVKSLINLAGEVVSSPEIQVKDINFIGDTKDLILNKFNKTVESFDDISIVKWQEQVEKTPDNIAIVHSGKQYTYREINERANYVAKSLRDSGIGRLSRVAITVSRSEKFIISILGILKNECCYVPIDNSFGLERQQYIINDSNSKALICDKENTLKAEFKINLTDERLSGNPEIKTESSDLAYIMYTSGSTGNPKGVMVTHENLYSYIDTFLSEFKLTEKDVVLQQASPSFDTFVEETYPVLLKGGTLIIADKLEILDSEKLKELINSYKITLISTSPLHLNEINKLGRFPTVHTYISGGDVLKSSYFSNLISYSSIYNTYGPTETTVCATYYKISESDINIPIGSPIKNTNVYILNENNKLLPPGIIGEISISGKGVSNGYVNNQELTNKYFFSDTFFPGQTMYKTGDIGLWTEEGNIIFKGRKDKQVKIRGYRIEPEEIESKLLEHSNINEAIVLTDKSNDDIVLKAFIKSDIKISLKELKDYLKPKLPTYMIPGFFYIIEDVPRNSNNKIDSKALLKIENPLAAESSNSEHLTDTEIRIKNVWETVLKHGNFGIGDSFFDIGGNSILIMQVNSLLEKNYKYELNIGELFNYPSIKELASFIESKEIEISKTLELQPLPDEYFNSSYNGSGSETLKLTIENEFISEVKEALEGDLTMKSLFSGIYIYLLSQISQNSRVTIQLSDETGDKGNEVTINFESLENFEQLFSTLHNLNKETYNLKDITESKRDNSHLPLLAINSFVDPLKFIKTFDTILVVKTDENYLYMSLTYNDRVLKSEKMEYLLSSYIDLLKQYIKNTKKVVQ